ncbi:MAG: cobyric acid synthase [Breznakibacter sp.]
MKKHKPFETYFMEPGTRLFVAGTCSDAGKSLIVTGLCRIFLQDGFCPAPYKAQNMSLNSYATPQGLEIGRAQAVQAEACRIDCHTDMNPILLKPTGDLNSQVVLHGKPIGNRSARDYFRSEHQKPLFDEAFAALERLSAGYNPVVMEGAGSIAELNLRHRDIVNMPMALRAKAPVLLVADIERGGVFASVYGSVALLSPEERALVKGVLINKFRGDVSLFDDGKRILRELTGLPIVGVVPWANHFQIEEEDSVALVKKRTVALPNMVNVCVVALPRMSNFTDFDIFRRIGGVNLYFSGNANEVAKADAIILPGSKNTIGDLEFLHRSGLSQTIKNAHAQGKYIVGICGGYQMLGVDVLDPSGIEGGTPHCSGLGLLPLRTVIEAGKTTQQTLFRFRRDDQLCKGYEIHMGRTTVLESVEPVNRTVDGTHDGAWASEKCWGTYMHGIFDNAAVIRRWLSPLGVDTSGVEDHWAYKQRQYDLLADHLRKHIDMEMIYSFLR